MKRARADAATSPMGEEHAAGHSAARRRALRGLVAGSASLLLGACSSLISRPAPVKHTFLLDPPLPAAAGTSPKPIVLRVGAVNVAAPFRGKQLVFRRSDLGYESDYYDEWFVPPGTMLADAIAKGMAAAAVFQRVLPAGAAGNEGDFLLEGFASAFHGDARTSPGTAELAIAFYVTSMDLPGSAPVWSKDYSAHAPLGNADPQALPAALNTALGTILRELAQDLSAADLRKR